MANIILVALALQGTVADLRAFQDAVLVAKGDAWALACSPEPTIRLGNHGYTTDRSHTAWDAGWTSTSPNSAVLSFSAAWEPSFRLLNAIGALAQEHHVAVVHGAAIDEIFPGTTPSIWAGEGLHMRRVEAHTPKSDALLGAAHRPTVRHGAMAALARMDRTLAAAA